MLLSTPKRIAKEKQQQGTNLENQLKKPEEKLNEENLSKCNSANNELDNIYDHIAEGTRIRSKCDWYGHSEESTKFFLNLVKQRGYQNKIKKTCC